jgi:hypothetical protein
LWKAQRKSFSTVTTTVFEHHIPTICVQATSFPEGVAVAHQTLHSRLPSLEGRQTFGISYGTPDGTIVYFAAATELHEGEAAQLGCERFVIRQGQYSEEVVPNFMQNLPAVGATFEQLLQDPALDPSGYCLEIYDLMPHLRCLVLLR